MKHPLIYLPLICLLMSQHAATAQDTVEVFTYGGTQDDVCKRMFATNSGYVLFGTTASFGRGETDVYIVETDKAFTKTHSTTIGDWGIDRLTDVAKIDDGYILCGITNTDDFGKYTGKLWRIDEQFQLLDTAQLNFGEITTPEKILAHGEAVYVAGQFTQDTERSFILRVNTDLLTLQRQNYDHTFIGRVNTWMWDSALVVGVTQFQSTVDSAGAIFVMDSTLSLINQFELHDTLGVPRGISELHDSTYLVVGDKIDTELNGERLIGSDFKISKQLDTIHWQALDFINGWHSATKKAVELSTGRFTILGRTDLAFSQTKDQILVRDLTAHGSFVIGGGGPYGGTGNEQGSDLLRVDSDSILVAGYTDSYGAGLKDFMIMLLETRVDTFVYEVMNTQDTLLRFVGIDAPKPNSDACLANLFLSPFGGTVNECSAIRVINLKGQIVDEVPSGHTLYLSKHEDHVLFLATESEVLKIVRPGHN